MILWLINNIEIRARCQTFNPLNGEYNLCRLKWTILCCFVIMWFYCYSLLDITAGAINCFLVYSPSCNIIFETILQYLEVVAVWCFTESGLFVCHFLNLFAEDLKNLIEEATIYYCTPKRSCEKCS